MALEFTSVPGQDLDPDYEARLRTPRPDIYGYDQKVTSALIVQEYIRAVDAAQQVSMSGQEVARKAAQHILEKHSTEIPGLYSGITEEDLRLIAM